MYIRKNSIATFNIYDSRRSEEFLTDSEKNVTDIWGKTSDFNERGEGMCINTQLQVAEYS